MPANSGDPELKPQASAGAPAPVRASGPGKPRGRPHSRLGIEIAAALCVKLLLLLALHQIWFSHPQGKRLTERAVAGALFGQENSPLPGKEHPDGSGP